MHTPPAPAGLIAGLCLDNPIVADEIRHLILSERTTLVAPPWSSPISLPAGFEVAQ